MKQSSEAIKPDRIRNFEGETKLISWGRPVEAVVTPDAGVVLMENGMLAFAAAGEGIIRCRMLPRASEIGELQWGPSPAVLPSNVPHPFPKLLAGLDTGNEIRWGLDGGYCVSVSGEEDVIRFTEPEGRTWADISRHQWEENGAVSVRLRTSAKARYYGLGEKTGFLDKRGECYEMWNTDVFSPHVPEVDALYQSIPFLLVSGPEGAFGLFLDNPGRTRFDMRSDPEGITIRTETGFMDLYLIAGPGLKDVIGRYSALTGCTPLPPRWALGYHQSRFSYKSQEEVLELARTFRDKGIPCDAIHLDIHYMDGYRVFTFDPERFPEPAAMISNLRGMGFRVVPIVDPGVKLDADYSVCSDGIKRGFFCTRPDGQPFVGPVWPGDSLFPDFLSEQAAKWWGELYEFYTAQGVEGIWNDMNEPSVFNGNMTLDPDTLHDCGGQKTPHREVHNLYGLRMCQSTWEGMRKHLGGRRPFVLTRAGYAGIQKYAAVWTGDNRSFWEHMAMAIPMTLNLGMSGVAFAGSDIGGFAHHATGELLVRWTQMGALFPYCRNHSEQMSCRQEPWSFGPEVEDICRSYIRLRYRIMPYLYSLFRESSLDGLPVMRPLVLEYPHDPATANLCDQFLLGTGLMAAPVYRPDTDHRSVYIPEGIWYDYWTGERIEGGKQVLARAPLDTMPLYVKAGTLIPMNDSPAHSDLEPCSGELTVEIYAGGDGTFQLYEDDGQTYAYEKGQFNLYRLELSEEPDRIRIGITPLHSGFTSRWITWILRIKHLFLNPERMSETRFPEKCSYDGNLGLFTVKLPQPKDGIVLEFQLDAP